MKTAAAWTTLRVGRIARLRPASRGRCQARRDRGGRGGRGGSGVGLRVRRLGLLARLALALLLGGAFLALPALPALRGLRGGRRDRQRAVENLTELRGRQHAHAELLGLRELRARVRARDEDARLRGDRVDDAAAALLDFRAGVLARDPFERAGEHEAQTRQWAALDRRRECFRLQAELEHRVDRAAIARVGEERGDRARHLRAHAVDLLERRLVGRAQRRQRAEAAREQLRRRLADFGDAERDEEAVERRRLRALDLRHEVVGRLRAEAVELLDLARIEAEHVLEAAQQPRGPEL